MKLVCVDACVGVARLRRGRYYSACESCWFVGGLLVVQGESVYAFVSVDN